MPPRLPEPLRTYTSLPERDQLILLTSVLGASSSWLTHAFLYQALSRTPARRVAFVSLTQDLDFHVECMRKLGIDLMRQKRTAGLTFVGMDELSLSPALGDEAGVSAFDLAGIARKLAGWIGGHDGGGGEGVVVVLEGLDLLLATGVVPAAGLMDFVLGLHEISYSTVVSVNADEALMRSEEHAAFVTELGHVAGWVYGLRVLDTGVARDVSGVMRITGGEDGGKEVLYFVGDGGVDVFERGQVRDA